MNSVLFTPPVVRVDIDRVNEAAWEGRPLARHISDLERLLMVDIDAPMVYDAIPLRDAKVRSKMLVDCFSKSFQSNPLLRPMVKRVGEALMADRKERLNLPATFQLPIKEAAQSITRQVNNKQANHPRG